MQFYETNLNTELANCINEDPNIFFDIEEDGLTTKNLKIFDAMVRPICGSCPIWADCLNWAVTNKEPAGVWGGLTTVERQSLGDKRMSGQRQKAFQALAKFGITPQQIKAAAKERKKK
jgi:WhiB family redox-sensing transcriptional regulator